MKCKDKNNMASSSGHAIPPNIENSVHQNYQADTCIKYVYKTVKSAT